MSHVLGVHDFHVAIFCAISVESRAVESIFDDIYEADAVFFKKSNGDQNSYTTGRMGKHKVVLAYMPDIGKARAVATASSVNTTFPNIKVALVVGVCAGAPQQDSQNIYLGDVVISTKIKQTDFGRQRIDGFEMKTMEEGNMPLSSSSISSLLHKLQGSVLSSSIRKRTARYTKELLTNLNIGAPAEQDDMLYRSSYFHKHRQHCATCSVSDNVVCQLAQKQSCNMLKCDVRMTRRHRDRLVHEGPQIFLGQVSSSDTVTRNAITRDTMVQEHNVIAFEMEGAGIATILPTLVVKSVVDYGDSHKNKSWHAYGAITAAACTKALLLEWTALEVVTSFQQSPLSSEGFNPEIQARYLASLPFHQIDSRLFNIQLAHHSTCQWISKTDEFRRWKEDEDVPNHHRVLWIKGKPGCGKSTMMKHIWHTRKEHFSKYVVAVYFFHARGSNLQKTPLGMLRSLLYQLMASKPDLLDHFIRFFPGRFLDDIEVQPWTFDELQEFFLLSARQGWANNLVLMIDALDECDNNEAACIARFCEDLSLNAVANNAAWYFCISIRYFPHISMKKSIQLNLDEQNQHENDIRNYIESKFCVPNNDLVKEILRKANHVFLWAVLVVRSLNDAHDRGEDDDDLHRRLSNIPEELNQIFAQLIGPIESISAETRLVLQTVLHALRPLTLTEIYLVVIAGTKPEKLKRLLTIGLREETLFPFFISISKGLLEILKPNEKQYPRELRLHSIQFIHETVRSYFLRESTVGAIVVGAPQICHNMIARSCIASWHFISMDQTMKVTWANYGFQGFYTLDFIFHHIELITDPIKALDLLRMSSETFHLYYTEWPYLMFKEYGLVGLLARYYHMTRHSSRRGARLQKLLRMVLTDDMIARHGVSGSDHRYDNALECMIKASWTEGVNIAIECGARVVPVNHNGQNLFELARENYVPLPSHSFF